MPAFRRLSPMFALAALFIANAATLGQNVLLKHKPSPVTPTPSRFGRGGEPPASRGGFWVSGYYPAWQNDFTPADVDYKPLTHIIYFALVPTPDGGLDAHANGVNDATANELASTAHAAGKKVLICVGGEDTAKNYRHADTGLTRAVFVRNIVDWIATHHYDGVDIDFEPMKPEDGPDFQSFIRALRAALDRLDRKLIITAAVECGGSLQTFAPIQKDFAQLNLMTYDMAGEWSPETWYNSPLSNNLGLKDKWGDVLPSTDQFVPEWLNGIKARRLGIGVCCEGRVWHGADHIHQPRNGNSVETIAYHDIMDKYYAPDRYQFDNDAMASSLVVPANGSVDKSLVVYDDLRDIDDKVAYAKKMGLGGFILWELSEEYRPNQPIDHRHPLSTEVSAAIDGELGWVSTK